MCKNQVGHVTGCYFTDRGFSYSRLVCPPPQKKKYRAKGASLTVSNCNLTRVCLMVPLKVINGATACHGVASLKRYFCWNKLSLTFIPVKDNLFTCWIVINLHYVTIFHFFPYLESFSSMFITENDLKHPNCLYYSNSYWIIKLYVILNDKENKCLLSSVHHLF